MEIPDWREKVHLLRHPVSASILNLPPSHPPSPLPPTCATLGQPPGFPLASKSHPHRHMIRPTTSYPQSVISPQCCGLEAEPNIQKSILPGPTLRHHIRQCIAMLHILTLFLLPLLLSSAEASGVFLYIPLLWRRLLAMGHCPHLHLHPLHHVLPRLGKSKGRGGVPDCESFESRKSMRQENILFLVLLLCLTSTAEAKGGRGGRSGGGGGGGYLCFGQGCSGLDIFISCLTLVLIIFTMCRCLRDCAECCDEGSEDEDYYETVWIK